MFQLLVFQQILHIDHFLALQVSAPEVERSRIHSFDEGLPFGGGQWRSSLHAQVGCLSLVGLLRPFAQCQCSVDRVDTLIHARP